MRATPHVSRALATMFALATASVAFAADGGDWTVSKSSGEVWFTGSGVQQAALRQEDVLKPGDTISTGRTGRVLLKRGDEMILVSPNSVIGVPAEKKEGLSTTIKQQAGSILLDVEKRNVKHFEVETPYLAAVVKGTQFRVTVNAGKTTVDVVRGQVEVADFKSGQIAQVMAGQHATAFASGKTGLSLGGTGTLAPIEQGKPRAPSVERVPVPRGGFTAIRHATNGQDLQPRRHTSVQPAKHGVTRISSSIGEVRVNFHRVTNGLAHAATSSGGVARGVADTNTVWNSSGSDSTADNNGQGDNGNGAAASAAGRANASAVAAVAGGNANSGNGNSGNGNSGSDNAAGGSGNSANGSGRGNGHANNGGGNGRGR
jgi:FecR protein